MMPELYLADALGAAGKPIMRVHTAGSVGGSTAVVATHLVSRACAERVLTDRLREAVRGRHHVGPLRRSQRRRRRRRLLRPAHPRLHRPLEGARVRRLDGRGEGPPERAEEPVRAPEAPRHHASRRCATPRWCGSRSAGSSRARRRTAPAPWCSPTRQGGDAASKPPAWVHGTADPQRARPVPRARPGEPAGRPGLRRRRVPAGRHHEPARRRRRRRVLRPVQLVRADVDGEPRLRRARRGLEAHRGRRRPRSTATCR